MAQFSRSVVLRRYEPHDLPGLVSAWNEAAPDDQITEKIFRNRVLLDSEFDSGNLIVAEECGQLVGSVYGVAPRRGPRTSIDGKQYGWIPYFFVTPRARRRGLGLRLVQEAINALRDRGVSRIYFSHYAPGYFLPGLDAALYPEAMSLLTKLGFAIESSPAAMSLELSNYRRPPAVQKQHDRMKKDGWSFGSPTNSDVLPLLSLVKEEFDPDWQRLMRENIVYGMPLSRITIVKDPENRIAGWSMHGSYEGVLGRFGPFGVAKTHRGLGLGNVLLDLTLHKMREIGEPSAWFLWADQGSAAESLYEKAGFSKSRTFHIMALRVQEGRGEEKPER